MNGPAEWLVPALLAAILWGAVGVLQKLGSSRLTADSLIVWVTAGYVLALPLMLWNRGLTGLQPRDWLLGIFAGAVNGLGTWFLFASLNHGAKAAVAIPLTALYPLVTLLLSVTFLAERLSAKEWFGVVLALCAGALLSCESESLPPSPVKPPQRG